MRADRLLTLLITLQLRGRTTADVLAAQLEVSPRTIYRDVEALSRAGVPIFAERGRAGGLALLDGYQTELTGLTDQEAEALPFAGLSEISAALGLAAAAEAARLKVLAALPKIGRERAYRISECFHLDPIEWYRRASNPQFLRTIAPAVWANQCIEMDYESWRTRTKRIVEPLGLVLKAGHWYLLGRQKKKTNIYRVEGIHGVRICPRRFSRPRGFSLPRWWREEVTRFENSLRRAKATLRIAQGAVCRAAELGADVAEAIRGANVDVNGWREVSIWIESIDHAAKLLLGFGTDIEVMSPMQLRVELADRAASLHALYGRPVQQQIPQLRA
jgi:predicted DNA-binding transcriptional regulator YafY